MQQNMREVEACLLVTTSSFLHYSMLLLDIGTRLAYSSIYNRKQKYTLILNCISCFEGKYLIYIIVR